MTQFLLSDDNKDGYKLEDILMILRKDILLRCSRIVDDHRPEALHVLGNNMKILNFISEAITLAEDSTATLDRSFGPKGESHRIGDP